MRKEPETDREKFRALNFEIMEKERDALRKQAQADCRTLSGQIRHYILRGLKADNQSID